MIDLTADGPRCLLELPAGFRFRLEPQGKRSDVIIEAADPSTVPEPDGPQGRWRLVEGRYRKLEL